MLNIWSCDDTSEQGVQVGAIMEFVSTVVYSRDVQIVVQVRCGNLCCVMLVTCVVVSGNVLYIHVSCLQVTASNISLHNNVRTKTNNFTYVFEYVDSILLLVDDEYVDSILLLVDDE